MTSPPIYSRQPPDGHEFPDYEELNYQATSSEIETFNDHDAMDSLENIDLPREQESISSDQENTIDTVSDDMIDHSEMLSTPPPTLPPRPDFITIAKIELRAEMVRPDVPEEPAPTKNQFNGQRSSLDFNFLKPNQQLKSAATTDIFASPRMLHSRSQSLVDISKPDRWSQMAEQRQRGLSKLKGLVIPEHVPNEPYHPTARVHDLPEITSSTNMPKIPDYQPPLTHVATLTAKTTSSQRTSLNLPIWKQQEANIGSSLPKYSPAFKRRSLQLYPNGNMKPRANPATAVQTSAQFSTSFNFPETESQTPLAIISSSEDGVSFGRNSSLPSLNDSDNDSAFKSCDSLHSLEYNNTMLKDIETVNKLNTLPGPVDSASTLNIFQKKYNKFETQTSKESSPQISSPRTNYSDNNIPGKLKQNLLKTNGDACKTEGGNKLKSNSYNNTGSRVRTVPKVMQNQPMGNVNDLRKKFQTPDAVPVAKMNSTPPLTKPLLTLSKGTKTVEKREEKIPTAVSTRQEPEQKLSAQDMQSAIKKVLAEFGESVRNADCCLVTLKPEIPGGSLGLTLAGGTDYEAKEITVYSIRQGSVASKENKLKKGDQILSINGKVMKNLTHADTTALLKQSKSEFEIVYCTRIEQVTPTTVLPKRNSRSFDIPTKNVIDELDSPITTSANTGSTRSSEERQTSSQDCINVTIVKTSASLGFSIAGGADSPTGDIPLIVKKVFTGGAAEKGGILRANDELLTIGEVNVSAMSRLDVWTMMKKLPEGPVSLTVRR